MNGKRDLTLTQATVFWQRVPFIYPPPPRIHCIHSDFTGERLLVYRLAVKGIWFGIDFIFLQNTDL